MARTVLVVSALLAALTVTVAQGVDVFDDAAYHTYKLTLPADKWAAQKANAREEDWERANVSIAGVDFGFNVGLRFKGSSTLNGCFENNVLVCPKLSMKIRFDKYEGPRYQPGGIRTLNFHSMVKDPSKMHEKISYKLFNDMGIAAPRSHWANLVVNSEDFGIFSVVDQIDEVFVKRLGSGEGQLYKEKWPEFCSEQCFDNGLKEGSEDHSPVLSLQADITAKKGSCRLKALSRYFNVQDLYNFFAVDAAISNWDGPTSFYCDVSLVRGCSPHNFYLYRSLGNSYTLIPWDMDGTLQPITSFDAVPHWLSPGDCSARYTIFGGDKVQSAGCKAIFKALAQNPRAFSRALDKVLSGPFAIGKVQAAINKYESFLMPHFSSGSASKDDIAAWTAGVAQLRTDIPALHTKAIAYKTV